MKALVLVLVLIISVSAQSAKEGRAIKKWEFVAEGPLIRSYYSQDSIRRSGDNIKVWMRFELPKGSSQLYSDTPIDFGEVRIYGLLDCAKKKARAKMMMVYDRNGNFYAAQKDVQGWEDETPRSISYVVFEYFCERPTTPTDNPPTLKRKPS